jgi:hypothetical protein
LRRVLENLKISNEIASSYGTRRFIIVSTKLKQQILASARRINFLHTFTLLFQIHFNIILLHRIQSPKRCLSFRFSYQIFADLRISLPSHACYMPHIYYILLFDLNNYWPKISNYIALVKFDYEMCYLLGVTAFSPLEVHQHFEETHCLHFQG